MIEGDNSCSVSSMKDGIFHDGDAQVVRNDFLIARPKNPSASNIRDNTSIFVAVIF
jgi:hypothetical protein